MPVLRVILQVGLIIPVRWLAFYRLDMVSSAWDDLLTLVL